MTDDTATPPEAGAHYPRCNDRCIHYIVGDGSVREELGFPRVPRREPGGINPRQGVVTDPSPARRDTATPPEAGALAAALGRAIAALPSKIDGRTEVVARSQVFTAIREVLAARRDPEPPAPRETADCSLAEGHVCIACGRADTPPRAYDEGWDAGVQHERHRRIEAAIRADTPMLDVERLAPHVLEGIHEARYRRGRLTKVTVADVAVVLRVAVRLAWPDTEPGS